MTRVMTFLRAQQYRLLTLALVAVAVLGCFNTHDIASRLIPKHYWGSQLGWTERHLVFARRDLAQNTAIMNELQTLLNDPEGMRESSLKDQPLQIALRKIVANRQRVLDKDVFLRFKLERTRQQAAQALGIPRDPQPVEGF